MSDLELAKYNMIEQQIRPCNVNNPRVIEALHGINRHEFVPELYKNLAYADCHIPFSGTQIMMKPLIEGQILQALDIKSTEKCLEVGTGTGYFTGCLSSLADKVHSIDIDHDTQNLAKKNLSENYHNISFECADAFNANISAHKYDVIAITAAIHKVPDNFKHALTIGGRLFVIQGDIPIMQAALITRITENKWTTTPLFETEMNQLIH